ncbi:hypothetical protein P167DRAFT_541489 [Morchella conica CCBAS932]|uniref:Uncharacterized protein n=1 Tax=Morchella conica CCBAS932 TaxID=1392247 RepID=A0A3N4L3Q0_9PEZI|nr:hypothetical protein P167DRAFT_541489 [Morchella conica CCBAS932]
MHDVDRYLSSGAIPIAENHPLPVLHCAYWHRIFLEISQRSLVAPKGTTHRTIMHLFVNSRTTNHMYPRNPRIPPDFNVSSCSPVSVDKTPKISQSLLDPVQFANEHLFISPPACSKRNESVKCPHLASVVVSGRKNGKGGVWRSTPGSFHQVNDVKSNLGNLRLSMGRGIEHMQYAWFKAKVKVVVDADAVHTCNAASINRTNRSPRQYI